jgi:hypothetical protein
LVSATSAAAAQVSKSAVSKTLPEGVRAKSIEPPAEYHTRSTGPVAGEASMRSTEELPTFRQSGLRLCGGQEHAGQRQADEPHWNADCPVMTH